MANFNTKTVRTKVSSPIQVAEVSTTTTYNGGTGFTRTAKSDLFLLGQSFNEDTFYESSSDRAKRVRQLVKEILTEADGADWLGKFTNWLRNVANIRSMAIMIAIEAAKGMVEAKIPGGRAVVAGVLSRADEPADAVAYWFANYGRTMPQAIKRGIADGAVKLYNERSVLKYDSDSKAVRFADVIQLVHPDPKDAKQSDVFKFALDRRYNKGADVPASLKTVANRQEVKNLDPAVVRKAADDGTLTDLLKSSGMTWEALSSIIKMDAKAWEAVIPTMGYMALLRNLRNFMDAGVSVKVLNDVAARIADPAEVARSKQLPFRFTAAYNEVQGNRFKQPLEDAINASIQNIPVLKGKTLVLVDMSGSMWWGTSEHSKMNWADTAALFGAALALRAEDADLVSFGTGSQRINFRNGESVLELAKKATVSMGGTETADAVRRNFNGHDRVVLLTDEQSSYGNHDGAYGLKVPLYIWNLTGYKASGASASNVFHGGGLSDSAFSIINTIESARSGSWPWEQ